MKLTYKKDKSFDFESNYVEIHITVYTIPHNENITSLYRCVYTEFDVSLFELYIKSPEYHSGLFSFPFDINL